MDESKILTFYERFEQVIAIVLTFLMSLVIIAALLNLIENIVLLFTDLTELKQNSLHTVFGMIMSVLIALEFKHSILKVIARTDSIVKVKTVILIAILAISRKFIILDVDEDSATVILALSGAVLSLGVVYWLMRERDDR